MRGVLAASFLVFWICECGPFSLMMGGSSPPSPTPRGGSGEWAGGEVGQAGDKKGFTILRVLSEGGTSGQKDGKQKPKGEKLASVLMNLDPRNYPTPSAAKREIRKGAILVNGARGRVDQVVHLGSEQIAVQGRPLPPSRRSGALLSTSR